MHGVERDAELVANERTAASAEQQGAHLGLAFGEPKGVAEHLGALAHHLVVRGVLIGHDGGGGLLFGLDGTRHLIALVACPGEIPVGTEARHHHHEHNQAHRGQYGAEEVALIQKLHGKQGRAASKEDAQALGQGVAGKRRGRCDGGSPQVLCQCDPRGHLHAEHAGVHDGVGRLVARKRLAAGPQHKHVEGGEGQQPAETHRHVDIAHGMDEHDEQHERHDKADGEGDEVAVIAVVGVDRGIHHAQEGDEEPQRPHHDESLRERGRLGCGGVHGGQRPCPCLSSTCLGAACLRLIAAHLSATCPRSGAACLRAAARLGAALRAAIFHLMMPERRRDLMRPARLGPGVVGIVERPGHKPGGEAWQDALRGQVDRTPQLDGKRHGIEGERDGEARHHVELDAGLVARREPRTPGDGEEGDGHAVGDAGDGEEHPEELLEGVARPQRHVAHDGARGGDLAHAGFVEHATTCDACRRDAGHKRGRGRGHEPDELKVVRYERPDGHAAAVQGYVVPSQKEREPDVAPTQHLKAANGLSHGAPYTRCIWLSMPTRTNKMQ